MTVILCCPLLTQAQTQTYKCKKPNGAVSFQDSPCQVGSAGSKMSLPPVPSAVPQKPLPSRTSATADREVRSDDETRIRNAQTAAYNKSVRCNAARQSYGVLKEERPVYRRDNNGDRVYVDDDKRPAEIAAAKRRVDEECRS